ncbi:F-box domain-containing protein [Mycena kentingensis (nom. inval.)]|nr:F-box domain-containing protein [Mycena kentingensis (nom. inval.)]
MQLTELRVQGWNQSLLSILVMTAQLQTLELPAARYTPVATQIRLPRLRTLICSKWPNGASTLDFLDSLIALSLEDFQLRFSIHDIVIPTAFLNHVAGVRSLTLWGMEFPQAQDMIRRKPDLQRLKLHGNPHSLQSLLFDGKQAPNLRELVIKAYMRNPETSPASVLRARLASIDDERAAVHAHIATLREKLEQLAKARTDVASQLKDVTFPVLTIPNEVTAKIFAFRVADALLEVEEYGTAESEYEWLWTHTTAPFVLSQVCRAWRQIALSLPKLWANIFMGSKTSPAMDLLHRLSFERAASAPLNVDASNIGEQPRLYAILAAYSDQFERFVFALPNAPLDSITGRVEKLQELVINVYTDTPSYPSSFLTAQSLRKVTLHYERPVEAGLHPPLPWMQLTELRVEGNKKNLLEILTMTSRLETLELPAMSYIPVATPIRLPSLRTLICSRLEFSSTPSDFEFLRSLIPSLLEDLQLDVGIKGVQVAIPASFLTHVANVRALTLSGMGHYQARDVISRMPNLQRLKLENMPSPEMLLAYSELAPNLQDLVMVRRCVQFPGPALVRMLWARRAGEARTGRPQKRYHRDADAGPVAPTRIFR